MSSPLAMVDLTGAFVGTTASINFNQFIKFNPLNNDPAHLRVFNDSGCGLQYVMQSSGSGDYIPAGGWATIELMDSDSAMNLTVVYTLPNPPVSKILPTYYAPGEKVPETPILGNSPVGIGGSVSTSSVQTLSNESGARGLKIIDIGDLAFADLIDFFTDSFTMNVDQAGTKHQVLKGQTSGSPLLVGASGDTSEVLGNFLVDQQLAIVTLPTANTQMILKSSADATKGVVIQAHSATQSADLLEVQDGSSNNLVTVASSGILSALKGLSLIVGTIKYIAFGSTGTTAGAANTTTHGLGVIPTAIFIIPTGGNLSPAATGYQVGNAPTTTTFDIHTNTNLTFYWLAIA